MPPVAAVVGAVVGGALVAAIPTAAFLGLQGIVGGIAFAAVNIGLASLAAVLADDPNQASFQLRQGSLTTVVRQPITSWKVPFGEGIISGALTFYETTDDNRYHHLVITLAHRQIAAIKAVYLEDEPVYDADLDGSGNVISGKFAGKVRIKKHLGGPGQVADPDLVAEVAKVDGNFKGVGVAYLYVRTETDRDLFPQVIPANIKAWVKGALLFDTRDSTTRWAPNPALGVRDYLTDTEIGRRVAGADVDDTTTNAAANVCDEIVATKAVSHDVTAVDVTGDALDLDGDRLQLFTGDRVQVTTTGSLAGTGLALLTDYYVVHQHELKSASQSVRIQLAASYADALAETPVALTGAGTGTHTISKKGEPRYTLNGVVDTATKPNVILDRLRWAMAGFAPMVGPQWTIVAGAYAAPAVTFDRSHFRGRIKRQGRHSRVERFNAVHGVFVSQLNGGQPSDYPAITNATFQAADGGDRQFLDLDLAFTNRPQTAERIASIALQRHRREQTFSFRASLVGLKVQAGGTVAITEPRRGWTAQPFFVESWGFAVGGNQDAPELYTDFLVRETAPEVYDFDESTQEVIVPPAPIASPLDPSQVGNPTNLTLSSGTAELDVRLDGTVFSRIRASWTTPADRYVANGGRIELQYKRSSSGTWLDARPVDSSFTEAFILDVLDGVAYDVRVRSANQLGIRALTWVEALGHIVLGKSARPADVTNFSAQQNDNVVTFSWDQVSDADLAGYEIRYFRRGAFFWDSARVLTSVTRGTLVTNAGLPPGDWTVAIKARDTSRNYSLNATAFNIFVGNQNDVVHEQVSHPRWVGTLTNLVRHDVSGRLILKQNGTAAGNNFDVFDNFYLDPVAEGTYEPDEHDFGFDAAETRVWGDMVAGLGPGAPGAADPALSIDYRLAAGAYDGFEPWTIGLINARFLKARATLKAATGHMYLEEMTVTGDVRERTQRGEDETVAVGGSAVEFPTPFHQKPNVQVTVDGSAALSAVKSAVTTDGFTVKVFDDTNTDVGGTVDWEATGP